MKVHWSHHIFHPTHGPQTWPWWRLVTVSVVQAEGIQPDRTYGPTPRYYILWVYTRWGAVACDIDVRRAKCDRVLEKV